MACECRCTIGFVYEWVDDANPKLGYKPTPKLVLQKCAYCLEKEAAALMLMRECSKPTWNMDHINEAMDRCRAAGWPE